MRGAAIVRAHDVAETVDAVKVASALRRAVAGGD
jgi:dihydropteroate synthase